jgi:iron complex outermembrane receptor protein
MWREIIMKNYSKVITGISAVALSVALAPPVLAVGQGEENDPQGVLEEVITTGTRSTRPRSVTDSPVPVDVFSE